MGGAIFLGFMLVLNSLSAACAGLAVTLKLAPRRLA
jgi:hypothetical protein